MTEAEWLACTYVDYSTLHCCGNRLTQRKLRLLLCYAVRHIWRLVTDERLRSAVEVAEGFADGLANPDELSIANAAAATASGICYGLIRETHGPLTPEQEAAAPAFFTTREEFALDELPEDLYAVMEAAAQEASNPAIERGEDDRAEIAWKAAWEVEERYQLAVIRDLFGNPFHPPPVIDPSVPAWNGGAIRKLAQAVYDDRKLPSGHLDTDRLAVLADMLEEAGCAEADLLWHLRSSGPHVRVCWAVDLLLDKQ